MESVPENKPAAFEEDIFVDQLLDFSNGFSETEERAPPQPEVNQYESKCACSVFFDGKFDFGPFPEPELSVPEEGLESLEWLSHFTEDSFPDCTLTGKLPPENRSKPDVPVQQSCFESPVQTKARTKRARTGLRVWPVLSPSFTDSSTSSSSSTSSTFSPDSHWPFMSQTGESFLGKPLHMKQKKKPAAASGMAAPPRRCSHCGVTKTPQWRAGPLGSKTLCNACGVRFKSGRLLPEYRPACSPTFSTDLHSNNHRKVLQMRRQKETEVDETGLTLPPPVQCFLKSY